MNNKSDSSYRRYCQYRTNRQQYKVDQIAAPIVMMILIGVVTKFWWLIIAVVVVAFIEKLFANNTARVKEMAEPIEKLEKEVDKLYENKKNVEEGRMTMELKSTDAGYINKNNQKNLGRTNKPGTGNNQWFYQMECQECGHQYYANGHDVWLRKCPKCQGGQP